MRDWLFGVFFGIALGCTAMAVIVSVFGPGKLWEDTPQELEFEAYRHCLQMAGQMKCSMTPQDFVRYYEMKYLLEIEEQEQ